MRKQLQSLSNEQLQAINCGGDVLVTAIPGSGKTRTLINKIINEYNEEDSRYIVAVTFTRRAANEVEDRVCEYIGTIPNTVWIGTIHKFCLDFIVRGYGSYSTKFSKNFEIISEPDQDKIKSALFEKYGIRKFTPVDYTLDIYGYPNENNYVALVQEYFDLIFKMNKIDFNYILYESYRILFYNPFIAKQLSILIKNILIDEYQDTQELQYQILSLLSVNKKLYYFMVGDSNQAIFEGIGGVVKNKEELDSIFLREFTEFHLSGCYRSNQVIIDFYRNFAVEKYNMVSVNKEHKDPIIYLNGKLNKKQVFFEIFEIIENLLESGYKESEIAIVAPQWYQLYEISNEVRQKFPQLKFDAPNLVPLKKDEDGIINKICRLLLTTYDYFNLQRIKYLSVEIIKQFDEEYGYRVKLTNNEFLNLVNKSKTTDKIGTIYLQNSLKNLFSSLNLYEEFVSHIEDFINGTKERIQQFQSQGLEDDKIYFEQSLRSKSGIVISTFHGVKGEEYSAVIAFGLLEGYIPHWNDIMNAGEEAARKRSNKLLFVICSRAKERLYLFAENDRTTNNGNSYKTNKDLARIIQSKNAL